ncbi:FitA-like ribbon-helix-helix domain-containing protein [Isoptericola variabilis]|uniref:Antitoxin FitA-like ribbon-helix-helix domain-containing protein n=1 Tax=Isoptericola variabilis (strain 225) TaxID=743718 RepID=F6FQV8_ISOV2|nr:Arc family DNA-binding protein [Isoptericola variabilis]AEG42923.1 hypothetical protein Isova_0109 [Isoptericola variabilis 225]TWH31828.1 Arc-like DNA binding dprotein [Isoptericola variabilis J7]
MGTTITVRGLDDELHRQLKEQARSHHRSMEAEARAILAEGIGRPRVEVSWTAAAPAEGAGGDWIDRARELLADAWDDPGWHDDWLPERSHDPSRAPAELDG